MSKRSITGKFLLCMLSSISLLALVVLGYGYWSSITHASFYVELYRLAKPGAEKELMPRAKTSFMDADDNLLAKGGSDEKNVYNHILHPDFGDCHKFENSATISQAGRTAWQECFATMASWIPEWAGKVRSLSVVYRQEVFNDIPLKVSRIIPGASCGGSRFPMWVGSPTPITAQALLSNLRTDI